LAMTVGLPPSITATQEFVVPRSIPTTLAIVVLLFFELLLQGFIERAVRVADRAGKSHPTFVAIADAAIGPARITRNAYLFILNGVCPSDVGGVSEPRTGRFDRAAFGVRRWA
jgi:hypothetical protein